MSAELSRESLESAAHRYLQRYDATESHLRQVLERRARREAGASDDESEFQGFVQQWIVEIVARCVELRLVDDRRYAEDLARRLQRRGTSYRASWHKLRHKGVPETLIREQLGPAPEREQELRAASALARKRRLGPWRGAAQRAERRSRDLGALARAGFDLAVSSRVVDAHSPQDLPGDIPRKGFD